MNVYLLIELTVVMCVTLEMSCLAEGEQVWVFFNWNIGRYFYKSAKQECHGL